MEIVYRDRELLVCIKPAGVLSTDEPGGLPGLLRLELGDERAEVRTVHRLDRVVGGLMVLARSAASASELSRQIREGSFEKEYLAVVHGETEDAARLHDWMTRDKARKMSFVVEGPAPNAQEAILDYATLGRAEGLSLVRVRLLTGRTHQIRCQFAARGLPLVGERKYSTREDPCPLALWSCHLGFTHPGSGESLHFDRLPPETAPWDAFDLSRI